jgi:hypothetical protein
VAIAVRVASVTGRANQRAREDDDLVAAELWGDVHAGLIARDGVPYQEEVPRPHVEDEGAAMAAAEELAPSWSRNEKRSAGIRSGGSSAGVKTGLPKVEKKPITWGLRW